ncbi:MAG: citrate (Si)-synthase [Bacteroidota bacterium]
MDPLKKLFADRALALFQELRAINKEHGDLPVGEVTVKQVLGGARGVKMMLWETSNLDAIEGIRFRGYTIPELKKQLPAGPQGEPKPEGLFWLMLTGNVPTEGEVDWLAGEWVRRSELPEGTLEVLDALPMDTHPMTQFSVGVMAMQKDSVFMRRYAEGMQKTEYWDAYYEDTMNLLARLPRIAAYIYRRTFHNGQHIAPDHTLDWAANFAQMLGNEDPDFQSLMRLYLTIHADHEGGNASAHTTHLVGSTLSDPYLSFAAGMNALAGPLHGLANQEVIRWILEMTESLGTNAPTKEQIAQYVKDTLDAGKVIPGYGHAVLRQPDPRFTAQKVFAEAYIKGDPIVETVWNIFDVVPDILKSLGKVKNPWPNVDAHSGALLMHYGVKEFSYYTVLFGVSRALGVLAAGCWSRALGMPIERPKSVGSDWVKSFVAEQA